MKTKVLALLCTLFFLGSCSSTKNIAYMQEAENLPVEVLNQVPAQKNPVAMPGDLLDILVSGINLESVKPFNRLGVMTEIGGTSYNNNTNTTNNSNSYYLVNNDGDIDFPVLGKLHIGGMNKSQIEALLISELYPKYLSERPTIDIRFKNFRVSVIGEVKNPGVYSSPNERLNVLEALAMAGDLNITGVRENVMLIRINGDGTRSVQRLNLNDKNLIASEFFDLQQNDVIYVQPNASKARQSWSIPPALTLVLSSLGTLISIATLIVTISK